MAATAASADPRRKFQLLAGTKMAEFVLSNRSVDIIQGPVGAGKTQGAIARIGRHIQQQRVSKITGRRMSRWALVRNSYPDLKNTTIKTWLELFPEETYGRFNWGQPPHHNLKFQGGDGVWIEAEIIFLALDKAEDIRKLRSTEFTGIFWNELPFIPKILFDEGDSRLRYPGETDHGGSEWHGMIADANAPDEDHWLAIMTGQVPMPPELTDDELSAYRWPPEWGFYMQPPAVLEVRDAAGMLTGYEVNPAAENLQNLRPGYYQNMWRAKEKPFIDSRMRNRIALVVDGAPVWPHFNPDVHVAHEPLRPVEGHNVVVGLDFGLNPAAIFMQLVNHRVAVQYELLGFNETSLEFAPRVKQFLETHYQGFTVEFYGDPKGRDKNQSAELTSYQIFANNGMTVAPAPGLANNDIQTRVTAVSSLLTTMAVGKPRFLLSPLCRTLKLAMAGRYHLVKAEQGVLKPKKDKYADCSDALQYGVLGLGEGQRMIGLASAATMRPVKVYKGRQTMRRVS